ncbi:MAG TPA: sodium-independent anion transporter, partial [Anaerolineales bacterium]|nr:sodium-independent anion transporter [Anaerolineales bacterium]
VAVFYANANEIRRAIDAEVEKRGPLTKGILIDLGASAYLDMTSIDMLADLVRDFNSRGILVVFARVLGQVRDQLRQAGALDEFGRDNMAPNLAAGLKRFRAVQRALRDAARQGAGA